MMISVLCHSQFVHTVILPFTNGNVELILAPIGTWEWDIIQDVIVSLTRHHLLVMQYIQRCAEGVSGQQD